MDIWFDGTPTKIDVEEVGDIIEFCARKLLPEIADDLAIDVTFSNLKSKNKEGFAACVDIEELQFDIELERTLSRSTMISTICHEMVHVKQTARGELEMGTKAISRADFADGIEMVAVGTWNGEEYIVNDDTYYDLPWEIEAYGREVGLKARYLKGFNNA